MDFHQGDLLWFFPEQVHQLVDRTPDSAYYVAVFKPSMIRSTCRTKRYQVLQRKRPPEGLLQSSLDPLSFDLLRHTMDRMMDEGLPSQLLNQEAGYGAYSSFTFQHEDPDMLNAGLRHLLLLGWRCQAKGTALPTRVVLHPAVNKALHLLSDPTREVTLPHLGKACGISAPYLSRIFAQQMGMNLSRYRNSVRLGRFLELYRQPTRPTILEAAYAAGFGSYPQFHKVFVATYGGSPRQLLRD